MPGRNPSNEPLGGCIRPFSKEALRQVERPGRITAASEELIHKETINTSVPDPADSVDFYPRIFHSSDLVDHLPFLMVHRIVVQVGVIVWTIKVFDGFSIIEVSFNRVLDFFMGHIFRILSSMIHVSSLVWIVFEVIKFCVSLCRLIDV